MIRDRAEYFREYYKKNKEKYAKYHKKYHQKNKKKLLARKKFLHIKALYGLTEEDYWQLVSLQNNSCAICGAQKPLCVDHCHSTGVVRGLLCRNCNMGLGNFEDDVSRIINASNYLVRGLEQEAQ